jgi:hypothetical protein
MFFADLLRYQFGDRYCSFCIWLSGLLFRPWSIAALSRASGQ